MRLRLRVLAEPGLGSRDCALPRLVFPACDTGSFWGVGCGLGWGAVERTVVAQDRTKYLVWGGLTRASLGCRGPSACSGEAARVCKREGAEPLFICIL